MFGIYFFNHPDLRRILSDYNFQGYPLKKDFPLSGFIEVNYNNIEGRLRYKKIKLDQEYRLFTYKFTATHSIYNILPICILSNSFPNIGTFKDA